MKTIYKLKHLIIAFLAISTFSSCVKDSDFDIPQAICSDGDVTTNKTIQEIFNASSENVAEYTNDDVIEAYVTSSDQAGNFYKTISLQSADGSIGFSVSVDQTDLYTIYSPGRKVYVKLKNLYTQIFSDGLEIGALYNDEVGRIDAGTFSNYLIKSCDEVNEDELVQQISIDQISDAYLNTLVEFTDVQFSESALGSTLYDSSNDLGGATNWDIQDVSGNTLIFRTSSFADFASTAVPEGNGTIRGVLTKYYNDYQLIARSVNDLNLTNERKRIGFAENIGGTKISIADLRSKYTGSDTTVPDDAYIEGIITMSGIDEDNMSNRNAYIQDDSGAIALRFSAATSVLRGYQVKVSVKDVLLSEYNGLLQANVDQNTQVEFVAENVADPAPAVITLAQLLSGDYESQLVQIDDVQFETETGTYSGGQNITDCTDTALIYTSSYATFADDSYPTGNGTIYGIASVFNTPQLLLRDSDDTAAMTGDRCTASSGGTSSFKTIFFTELADPNNNSAARFIEIYNSGTTNVDLTGWTIRRYTNDNPVSTSSIDLTGSTINVGQAFVIAAQANEFETVFGFAPDLAADTGGPADSNGDDNLELVDPDGNVVDTFGVPGEDGSSTNHEFEDGRAYRLNTVTEANPVYTFSEWQIWNDTGDAGTTNEPQDAPGNFTPGQR